MIAHCPVTSSFLFPLVSASQSVNYHKKIAKESQLKVKFKLR